MYEPPVDNYFIEKKSSDDLVHVGRLWVQSWQCKETTHRIHEHNFSKEKIRHPLMEKIRVDDFPYPEAGVRGLCVSTMM